MANWALRSQEVAWTGTCSVILHHFLFGHVSNGILIHQCPTRNQSGTPETVDMYIANYTNGQALDPASAGKLTDINHAARTSILHSQNCIVLRQSIQDWPVMISFPCTPTSARLCLHIPINKAMWSVDILEATLWDEALCSH